MGEVGRGEMGGRRGGGEGRRKGGMGGTWRGGRGGETIFQEPWNQYGDGEMSLCYSTMVYLVCERPTMLYPEFVDVARAWLGTWWERAAEEGQESQELLNYAIMLVGNFFQSECILDLVH